MLVFSVVLTEYQVLCRILTMFTSTFPLTQNSCMSIVCVYYPSGDELYCTQKKHSCTLQTFLASGIITVIKLHSKDHSRGESVCCL